MRRGVPDRLMLFCLYCSLLALSPLSREGLEAWEQRLQGVLCLNCPQVPLHLAVILRQLIYRSDEVKTPHECNDFCALLDDGHKVLQLLIDPGGPSASLSPGSSLLADLSQTG